MHRKILIYPNLPYRYFRNIQSIITSFEQYGTIKKDVNSSYAKYIYST